MDIQPTQGILEQIKEKILHGATSKNKQKIRTQLKVMNQAGKT